MKNIKIRNNSYRAWLNEQKGIKQILSKLSPWQVVVDLWAGTQPFKKDIEAKKCKYIAIDIEWEQDYIVNLNDQRTPIHDKSADAVMVCQTLEHIYQTQFLLTEIDRIIKPWWHIFISTPFVHAEHWIPYDFHRYTSFFYKQLQESFERKLLSLTSGVYWPANIFLLIAYFLDYGSFFLPYKIIVSPLIIVLNILIWLWNSFTVIFPQKLQFISKDSLASDYVALYQKN